MSPAAFVPAHQSADMAWGDTKHCRDFCLRFLAFQLNDLPDLLIGKFAQMMRAAMRPAAAIFGEHVKGVFFGRPKKQMARPDANGVVTPVTNKPAVQDRAVLALPSVGVRANGLAGVPKSAVPAGAKSGPDPKPAVAGFVRVVVKALASRQPASWVRRTRACFALVVQTAQASSSSWPIAVKTNHGYCQVAVSKV